MMSLGTITFNLLTYLSKDANLLGAAVLAVLFIGTLLPLIEIEETPEFMLHSRDSKKYLELLEKYRKLNMLTDNSVDRETINQRVDDHLALLDTFGTPATKKTRFYKVAKLSTYYFEIITLSLVGGFMNTTYSSIILNLSTLSLTDISLNGVMVGVIGLLSNLILMPILKTMKRKKWLLIFQILLLACGGILALVYKLAWRSSDLFKIANPIVAIVIVGAVVNALFVPYFHYVSEVFPVDLRGSANSIIQCAANLIPISTPWLCMMAEKYELHFLVGCCLVGLVSTPLTIFLRETHPDK